MPGESIPPTHTVPVNELVAVPGDPLEFSHREQTDVVLNHNAELADAWGASLKEALQDGVPASWQVLNGGGVRNVMTGQMTARHSLQSSGLGGWIRMTPT